MRTSRDITFNETEMAIFINIRSLSEETITLTTFTEIIEIIEDIADANGTNIISEYVKDAIDGSSHRSAYLFFESITVEPASVRRFIRHRKAISKAVGVNAVEINTMKVNAVGAAETPIIFADEEESEEEDYLPKTIIVKSIIVNEDKPTYEEIMVNSKEFQWREGIDEEIK
jgi:hypothetical protein